MMTTTTTSPHGQSMESSLMPPWMAPLRDAVCAAPDRDQRKLAWVLFLGAAIGQGTCRLTPLQMFFQDGGARYTIVPDWCTEDDEVESLAMYRSLQNPLLGSFSTRAAAIQSQYVREVWEVRLQSGISSANVLAAGPGFLRMLHTMLFGKNCVPSPDMDDYALVADVLEKLVWLGAFPFAGVVDGFGTAGELFLVRPSHDLVRGACVFQDA